MPAEAVQPTLADIRDADGDAVITTNDARICTLVCTKPTVHRNAWKECGNHPRDACDCPFCMICEAGQDCGTSVDVRVAAQDNCARTPWLARLAFDSPGEEPYMFSLLFVIFVGCVLGGIASSLRGIGPERVQACLWIGAFGALFGYFVIAFGLKLENQSVWSLVVLPALGAIFFLTVYGLILRFGVTSQAGNSPRVQTPPDVSTPSPTGSARISNTTKKNVPNTVSSDLFLSYASPDRDTARKLAAALQKQGWSLWWDRSIPAGTTFDQEIEAALEGTKCVVVLWSDASVNSDWVKIEAREAQRRRILVPAMIANVAIPLEFRYIQAADLTNWRGSDSDPRYKDLVLAIRRVTD